MMNGRKGLGKGLDALLGEYVASPSEGVHEVDIDLLDINLDQPRKRFDEDRLAELSSSIKLHGIVQPIIVRRKGDRYVIVAGERRYRAARMAGMKTVPAIIREFDERQFMEVALIENIQRENLNSMEIAAAIDFLIKQHDLTHEEIAHRIGKSRVSVTQIHRLLSLPPKVQEYIREGRLQFGHARPLVGVGDPALQSKLADRAIEQGWSSRELERNIAHELNRTPKPRSLAAKDTVRRQNPSVIHDEGQRRIQEQISTGSNNPTTAFEAYEKQDAQRPFDPHRYTQRDPDLVDAQNKLRERLGVKITIRGSMNRGSLVIDYYNKEHLAGLYDMLMGHLDPYKK
jgi:ParB family chromosome partitioning protein